MQHKPRNISNLLSRRSLALLLVSMLGLGWLQPAQAALVWQIQTIDSTGDVGKFTSLVLDRSGNPVISYYDATHQDLKLLHCGNATCSSGNSTVTVDSDGNVGLYTSLVLDSSGNPVISYQDVTFLDLKLAHCGNPTCSSGNHIQNVAGSSGELGYGTSLRLDSSGNPVISYTDNSNNHLKLAHCANPNCTGVSSIVTVDSGVGWSNSLALNSSGNPVISYDDISNSDLKLVTCGDRNCSNGNIKIAIDNSLGSIGQYNSLVLDSAGRPVISYYDNANGDLMLVHCSTALCSGIITPVTVDSGGDVGRYSALVLDSSSKPVISYYHASNGTLKLAHCGNFNCTSGNQIQTVDSDRGRIIGQFTALALDSSGHPVISYYEAFNKDLKLARVVDDSTPPGVTLNQATGQADPASSGPIHFTAIFNEPVNNFATGDVTLSGSAGATTATVTQVAPNDGTTFDVAVSGMTNDGTVSVALAAGVATDAAGNPNTAATSTDNIVAFNILPVARDDAYTTLVDTPLLVAAPGVLGNDDSGPGHLPPFITGLVSSTGRGTLTLNPDGSFSYVPQPGYVGLDSFTYRAHNAMLASNLAIVTIGVNQVNQPPVAVDDNFTTNAGLAVTGNVLKNDSNPKPQPNRKLTASKRSDPGHGTLTLHLNGLFTYTPLPGFTGTDSFTYQANDGKVDSNIATVTIQVLASPPVNTAPVANGQMISMAQNSAKSITLTGDDAEGDPLIYTLVTQPSHGAISGTAPTLTYTPLPGFTGTDSFTYQVNDGQADSNLATIAIEVITTPPPVNTAPVAHSQAVTTAQNSAKSLTLTGDDADGDALTYTLLTQPGQGVLGGMAPNLTYTPVTGFTGTDSFTFQVNDGQADSNLATVTIQVVATPPVNTAPIAHSQTVTTTQGSQIALTLSATDGDGDGLTYQVINPPVHGRLDGMAPALVYTPIPGYNGADSFTYKVHDGQMDSALATVQINVTTQPNRPPAAQDDAFTVVRNSQGTVLAVLTNDHDPDGDGLTLVAVAAPVAGAAQIVNGHLHYTPAADFVGGDQFTYTLSDGKATVVASVSVSVMAAQPVMQAVYLPLVQR